MNKTRYENLTREHHAFFRTKLAEILQAVGELGDISVWCYPSSHPVERHLEAILQNSRKLRRVLDDELLRVYLVQGDEYQEMESNPK